MVNSPKVAYFLPSSGDGPSKQDADVPPQLQDHRCRSARPPLLCRLWCQPPRSLKFKFLGQHHDVHHVRLFLESQLFRGFQQQRHGQVNLICNLQRWIICRCPIYCFELQKIICNIHPWHLPRFIWLFPTAFKNRCRGLSDMICNCDSRKFHAFDKAFARNLKNYILVPTNLLIFSKQKTIVFKKSKSAKVPQSWLNRASKICNRMISSVKCFKSSSNIAKCRFELKIVIPQHQLSGLNKIGCGKKLPEPKFVL